MKTRARNYFDPTHTTTTGWSGPQDQKNKTDKFLSFFGVMYVIGSSRKDKGKALKDIVPRWFDARIEGIKGQHQQAIKEKDVVVALMNDDNQIQAIKYENVALQAQRYVYKDQL